MNAWAFVATTARLLRTLSGAAKLEIQRLFARLIRRASLQDQMLALRYIASI
jgi:hypothetical protein